MCAVSLSLCVQYLCYLTETDNRNSQASSYADRCNTHVGIPHSQLRLQQIITAALFTVLSA